MMPVKQLAPHFQFAAWRIPHFPLAIESPLEILEEIRAFACDELLQVSHGGDEVGGVLFGARREDLIRILTWRPMACEHTQGEGLKLSYNDRMNLAVQLEVARQNAELKQLRPVGWFVSHLRGDVALTATDLDIYNSFFPEAWQLTLAMRPKGNGRAQAGFFMREADGKVRSEASYHTFDLQPLYRTHVVTNPIATNHIATNPIVSNPIVPNLIAPLPIPTNIVLEPEPELAELLEAAPTSAEPAVEPVTLEQPALEEELAAEAELIPTEQPALPVPDPVPAAEPAPEATPVQTAHAHPIPEPVSVPEPFSAPQPVSVPRPVSVSQPFPGRQPVSAPQPPWAPQPVWASQEVSYPPLTPPPGSLATPPTEHLGRTETRRPAPPPREIPAPNFKTPSFDMDDTIPSHERWLWAIPVLLALGIAGFLLYHRSAPAPNPSFTFRALSDAKTVQLTWNPNSAAVRDSGRGEIEINDGGRNSQISLNDVQLREGGVSYTPQSNNVGFTMTLFPSAGEPIHESTRIVTPAISESTPPSQSPLNNSASPIPLPAPTPASPTPQSPTPQSSTPQLTDEGAPDQEVKRLREELGKERARANELQSLVRILENRLSLQSTVPRPEHGLIPSTGEPDHLK
jgi:hypothetical protein